MECLENVVACNKCFAIIEFFKTSTSNLQSHKCNSSRLVMTKRKFLDKPQQGLWDTLVVESILRLNLAISIIENV